MQFQVATKHQLSQKLIAFHCALSAWRLIWHGADTRRAMKREENLRDSKLELVVVCLVELVETHIRGFDPTHGNRQAIKSRFYS